MHYACQVYTCLPLHSPFYPAAERPSPLCLSSCLDQRLLQQKWKVGIEPTTSRFAIARQTTKPLPQMLMRDGDICYLHYCGYSTLNIVHLCATFAMINSSIHAHALALTFLFCYLYHGTRNTILFRQSAQMLLHCICMRMCAKACT